jgi:hypothetical protein
MIDNIFSHVIPTWLFQMQTLESLNLFVQSYDFPSFSCPERSTFYLFGRENFVPYPERNYNKNNIIYRMIIQKLFTVHNKRIYALFVYDPMVTLGFKRRGQFYQKFFIQGKIELIMKNT